MSNLIGIKDELVAALHSVLGIKATVKLVEPHSIKRSEGKSKRIIDRSELNK
jgi:phenylacetate-CoA ligase